MTHTDPTSAVLKQFFGAYFHEDWTLDATDSGAVVEEFLAEGKLPPIQLLTLATAIDEISTSHSELELPSVMFDKWGAYYRPVAPETYASWLTEIATQFRQAARGR